MRERGGPICSALCRRNIAFDILVPAAANPNLQKFERARNTGQQIVEIVREAAGQLPHGFHLLGLF